MESQSLSKLSKVLNGRAVKCGVLKPKKVDRNIYVEDGGRGIGSQKIKGEEVSTRMKHCLYPRKMIK